MATVSVEKNICNVEPLYQWDLNQELVIYGLSLASIPEVHFSNALMGKALVRQATMDKAGVIRAEVPNSLLQKPYSVQAYVCVYEGDTFETVAKLDIPVKARNKPEDYTLEDDPEVYSFNELENQVVNALAKVAEAEAAYKSATTALEDAVEEAAAAIDDTYRPRVASITLAADAWVEGAGVYTQEVSIPGAFANVLVALQLSNDQMLELIFGGVSFLKVDNDGGTFIATAGGAAPASDMTIQVTLEEVSV